MLFQYCTHVIGAHVRLVKGVPRCNTASLQASLRASHQWRLAMSLEFICSGAVHTVMIIAEPSPAVQMDTSCNKLKHALLWDIVHCCGPLWPCHGPMTSPIDQEAAPKNALWSRRLRASALLTGAQAGVSTSGENGTHLPASGVEQQSPSLMVAPCPRGATDELHIASTIDRYLHLSHIIQKLKHDAAVPLVAAILWCKPS